MPMLRLAGLLLVLVAQFFQRFVADQPSKLVVISQLQQHGDVVLAHARTLADNLQSVGVVCQLLPFSFLSARKSGRPLSVPTEFRKIRLVHRQQFGRCVHHRIVKRLVQMFVLRKRCDRRLIEFFRMPAGQAETVTRRLGGCRPLLHPFPGRSDRHRFRRRLFFCRFGSPRLRRRGRGYRLPRTFCPTGARQADAGRNFFRLGLWLASDRRIIPVVAARRLVYLFRFGFCDSRARLDDNRSFRACADRLLRAVCLRADHNRRLFFFCRFFYGFLILFICN